MKVRQSGRWRQDFAYLLGEMLRRHGAVRLDDVHARAAAGEFGGHQVAGDGGARQQDALALQVVGGEGFQQTFGDVLLAHQVHLEMQGFDGGARGRPDGADFGAQLAQIARAGIEAVEEEAHAVGAGEDQPVVGVELGDGAVERARSRRAGGSRWWAARSRRRRGR